ncbi:N utilization substance protein B [bacterium HR40]|nr:N utilization substance protein B [bacterium HR40]
MNRRQPSLPKRRAARFAAVQALYQLEVGGQPVEEVVGEFRQHRLTSLLEPFAPEAASPPVDAAWFERVVRGAHRMAPELDPMIEACLAPGWTLQRCGYLLRACLRAGAFELAACPDVPVAAVINEYVEVAHMFFDGDEPAFVNAVLDRLARRLRAASSSNPAS